MKRALLISALLLAGCPHHHDDKPKDAAASHPTAPPVDPHDGLPPAPPLPAVPAGLPPLPDTAATAALTPDLVALGALLFADPRLSASGKTSCASCHDPAHGFSGGIDNAADGKPNLRRTPALVNLAWATSFDWDGRYDSIGDQLTAHMHGQLGAASADLDADATYAAHFARVGGDRGTAERRALAAYVLTRYAGDAPWDRREPSARAPAPGSAAPDAETAGYVLFMGKAQCGVCHTPPLYTDGNFHRVGKLGVADEGRGRVDPSAIGQFKTPTLRGAASRKALFHTGDVTSLDDAIRWYEQVAASAKQGGINPLVIDPVLARIALTPDEHAQLLAFVRALSAPTQ